MNRTTIALASAVLCLAVAAPAVAQSHTYKILATSKTSTMQKEMQEAGDTGFRFVAVMGGETAIGGKEVVMLVEKAADDKNTYSYRLLATSKTSTLQKELQEAGDDGFHAVGQTVFESMFGGKETVAIVQKSSGDTNAKRYLAGVRRRNYDYDRFWVVFPLRHADGAPLFDADTNEAELVVRIADREGRVKWPIPPSMKQR